MKPDNPESCTIPPDGKPMEAQPQWRQDFPIDWPQDHYVARRDFTKFLVLTSFAFSVGQFWIAFLSLRQKAEPATRVKIGTVAALPVGKSLVFAFPGEHDKCVLTRVEENTFTAYSQSCTHLSCAVIPEPEKGRLFCPCHEGAFDLKTGRPIAGPPRRPLPRIQLDIRGGEIFATGIAPEESGL